MLSIRKFNCQNEKNAALSLTMLWDSNFQLTAYKLPRLLGLNVVIAGYCDMILLKGSYDAI